MEKAEILGLNDERTAISTLRLLCFRPLNQKVR